jgi:hypothetical protein
MALARPFHHQVALANFYGVSMDLEALGLDTSLLPPLLHEYCS